MQAMEAGAVPRVAPPMVPTLSPRLLRLASDSRLVGLVRDGRPGAFEAVYDRHQRGILAFCRHILADPDEAEDAVQHTFMAAYSDLIRSEKPIHLRAWLFTIARNRCYTILRGRREQPAADLEGPIVEELTAQVQRRQELRELVHDLRELPEEQRVALVLAELDALSHAEIAEVLGIPREKVKALVFQARESLVASRSARDTACSEIREQISCGRGAALRRANLRRHLRDCQGCREFRAEVERQRRRFGLLLPLGPSLALKEAVLGVSGGATIAGGGAVASGVLKGGLAKAVLTAVVVGLGTAGSVVVATESHLHIASILSVVTGADGRASGGVGRAHRPGHAVLLAAAPATGSSSRRASAAATLTATSSRAVRVSGTSTRAGASHAKHPYMRLSAPHRHTPQMPAAPAPVTGLPRRLAQAASVPVPAAPEPSAAGSPALPILGLPGDRAGHGPGHGHGHGHGHGPGGSPGQSGDTPAAPVGSAAAGPGLRADAGHGAGRGAGHGAGAGAAGHGAGAGAAGHGAGAGAAGHGAGAGAAGHGAGARGAGHGAGAGHGHGGGGGGGGGHGRDSTGTADGSQGVDRGQGIPVGASGAGAPSAGSAPDSSPPPTTSASTDIVSASATGSASGPPATGSPASAPSGSS
jgi:RNA polymerase sigma factor (sigma-70 family)